MKHSTPLYIARGLASSSLSNRMLAITAPPTVSMDTHAHNSATADAHMSRNAAADAHMSRNAAADAHMSRNATSDAHYMGKGHQTQPGTNFNVSLYPTWIQLFYKVFFLI